MGEAMTGYQSKKTAALDEEGMYLVHHTQQEPIGEVVVESMGVRGSDAMQVRLHFYKKFPPIGSKIYTSPPQRPWVGLTEEEWTYYTSYVSAEILNEIEQLLKSKNT